MADVNLTFSGDDRDTRKAFERLQRENAKLRERLAQTSAAAKEAGKSIQKAFKEASQEIQSAITLTGLQARGQQGLAFAMELVNDAIEARQKLQGDQQRAAISAADAEAKAMRNLGQSTRAERDALRGEVSGMASSTGFSKKDIWMQYSTALSAKGNLSQAAVTDAIKQSTRLVPEAGEAQTRDSVTGAALDLAKITGTDDAQSNLGLMMAVGQRARVTDVGSIARNIVPAIGAVKSFGGTDTEAASLVAALTQASGDSEGAKSRTASIQLAEQLRAAMPKESSLAGRISTLQGNAGKRKAFLDNLHVEAEFKPVIEKLLTDTSSTAATEFAANLKALPSDVAKRRSVFGDIAGGVNESDAARAAGYDRRMQAAAENQAAGQTGGATTASARDALKKALDAGGYAQDGSWLGFLQGRRAITDAFEARTAKGEDPQQALEGVMSYAVKSAGDNESKEILRGILEEMRKVGRAATKPSPPPGNAER